ncbi:Glyoxalase/Bleomycin resistance protein/Dihydroxybiphenyl dioxygenase [Xylariales sp. PMI_506]|nr:Glyoxalase/Bleomycin resistance protein/Dihydroxybiphenyl dioxygenase [Xylariales sp. PMI_506]
MTSTWKQPKYGAPCWMGIPATDVKRASDFYAAVFNWEFTPPSDEHPTEEVQMFTFRPDVELSGGFLKTPNEQGLLKPGRSGVWMSWLVEDLDTTAALVEKAGGKVLTDAVKEGKSGLYRYFEDTEGNMGAFYQFIGNCA